MTTLRKGTYIASIYPQGSDFFLVIWANVHADGYQQVLRSAPSKTYSSFDRAKKYAQKKLNELA